MRDYQRAKFYAAEAHWLTRHPRLRRTLTPTQAAALLHRLAARHRISTPALKTHRNFTTNAANYSTIDGLIRTEHPATEPWAVAHELAHHGAMVRSHDVDGTHGPVFCRWYVRVVRREWGDRASAHLFAAMLAAGCDVA